MRSPPDLSRSPTSDIQGRRVPWVVAFLARRLAWAVITLAIYLTAVFFFMVDSVINLGLRGVLSFFG